MNSQYASNMLVRDPESVAPTPALERQKPTAETLLNRVECITNYTLRQLLDLVVDVVVHDALEAWIRGDLAFEDISADDKRGPGDTNLRAVGRPASIERGRDPNGSLGPDYPDLDHPTVFENLKFGHHRRFGEEDIVNLVVLLIQVLIFREIHALEKLPKPYQMFGTDSLKKCICRRARTAVDKNIVIIRALPDACVVR
jgi:hypothetical protein